MASYSTTDLRRLEGRLGEIVYQLTRVRYSSYPPPQTWRPAVNAYRCDGVISICADLAGVDKESIDLRVEPRRLLLRGRREAPDPEACSGKAQRVLAMEIDYGPFERQIVLEEEVDVAGVTATQQNGMLWVTLPLASQA